MAKVWWCPYLGCEVPVEDALSVQVGHAPRDVGGQGHSLPPGDFDTTGLQDSVQRTAVDVLKQKPNSYKQQK